MATIRDVAGEAGVSVATVSRVLNNLDVVTSETREKVVAAVAKLKFSPNLVASELRRSNPRGRRSEGVGKKSPQMSSSLVGRTKQRTSAEEQIQSLIKENRELKRAIHRFGRYLSRWPQPEAR